MSNTHEDSSSPTRRAYGRNISQTSHRNPAAAHNLKTAAPQAHLSQAIAKALKVSNEGIHHYVVMTNEGAKLFGEQLGVSFYIEADLLADY